MKEAIKKTKDFLTKRWVTNSIIIILFLTILILSSSIRLQNLPLLVDQTSGEYIPLALDPFYFLRVAETIVDTDSVPSIDPMRYTPLNLPYINEILPQTIVVLYKIMNTFDSSITLQYADVLYPVIFFVMGLIIFFLLVYILTRSKWIALLSSIFLSFIPPYLYRTMAGFSDHEALGMFVFFTVLLVYALALKNLEKGNTTYLKTILYSLSVAFLTVFMMISWGGGSSLILIIIPMSFLIIWLIRFKYIEKDLINSLKQYFSFYILWFLFTIIFGIIFNYGFITMIKKFTSSTGIIGSFTFGFVICEVILYLLIYKDKLINYKKFRVVISTVGTIIIGIILFIFAGKNVLQILTNMLGILITPFGADRVTLTVAENAQPFLIDWISQIGNFLYWLSICGVLLVGIEIGNHIENNKKQKYFSITWIIFIMGILFSRYSPNYFLNGENILSIIMYAIGVITFLITCIWIYFKEDDFLSTKIKLNSQLILFATLMLIMVLSIRSATRVFFLIVPFACISASFFIFKVIKIYQGNKDNVTKFLLMLIVIGSLFCSILIVFNSFNDINSQSKYIGPSANLQWQQAMDWVRDNTAKGSIFVSWWDYGYWIQYLGQRPTVTDGGHGNSYWDHLIGRYVLTTKNSNSALAFMKAQNVSYLLIDQTDLGKYPAYSKIGGDIDYDTFSIIPTGIVNNKQTIETKNITTRVYNIGGVVDEDIIYSPNNNEEGSILIPGPTYDNLGQPIFKSYLGGIIIEISGEKFIQPQGIFVYNNQQIKVPIRYLYFKGSLIDFGIGINSVVSIIQKIDQNTNGNINIDNFGAIVYLSPKVSKSLFAQLYLINDPFKEYPTITLAHSEQDPIVQSLRSQGVGLEEIIYYQGVRGPIKIFKVDYPEGFPIIKEFTYLDGEFAGLDHLFK